MDLALVEQISEADIDREAIARRGFAEFVRRAWQAIETEDLVWSWHLDEICKHLEAVSRGECPRLIINVPPGCSKSRLVSILWPAWDWLGHPARSFMFATYSQMLMRELALENRRLVKSPWYHTRFGDRVAVAKNEDTAETISVWKTRAGGVRFSTTVAGQATGFHAHIQVVDDPNKPEDMKADPEIARAALERTWTWWNRTMASRKKNPRDFARVIIMQRLHEEDLVGRIMNSAQAKEYVHLSLPMQFESPGCKTPFGGDQRKESGELLCPARFDLKLVETTRIEMGSQVAAAQLQQRPAPAGGNVFKRIWFRKRWRSPENYALLSDEQKKSGLWILRPPLDEILQIQVWDCAFKDSAQADPVGGHIWGYHGAKFLLLDRLNERMGLPETCGCIKGWVNKWPKAYAKLIEDKANGPAVEQVLRDKVTGIIMVDPADIGGSKVGRANAIAPLAEAENIILPDECEASWVGDVVEDLVTFPFARHDEDVDCMTMGVLHLHGRSNAKYLRAMERLKQGDMPAYFRRAT